MNLYSEIQKSVFDDEETRFTKKIKYSKDIAATKAKLDAKISGYQKTLPVAIDASDDTSHILPVIAPVMNLKVIFLGPL